MTTSADPVLAAFVKRFEECPSPARGTYPAWKHRLDGYRAGHADCAAQARHALDCLRALLDRDITYIDASARLPFETHDQAINHIAEARIAARKATK